jgi:hypothetical protein
MQLRSLYPRSSATITMMLGRFDGGRSLAKTVLAQRMRAKQEKRCLGMAFIALQLALIDEDANGTLAGADVEIEIKLFPVGADVERTCEGWPRRRCVSNVH